MKKILFWGSLIGFLLLMSVLVLVTMLPRLLAPPPGSAETAPASPASVTVPAPTAYAGWGGSWAPDGRKFVMALSGGRGLEIRDAQSTERTPLVYSGKDPVWSPDGGHIVFVRDPQGREDYLAEEIWVVQPDGKQERRLARGGYPKWAPDGKTVYFHNRSDNSIRTIMVDAEEPTPQMFFERSLSWYPAVSPDGKAIAFGTGGKLVVVERATRKTLATWPTRERGLLPGWSPDGRYVGFGGYGGTPWGLWCLDMQASNAVQLAEGPYTLPVWSPDGKRIAFDYRGKPMETWVASQEWFKLRMEEKVPVLQHEPATTIDGTEVQPRRKPR